MEYNPLTPEEQKIIIGKETERPFTGKYNDFWERGVYLCRRCNAPLYDSRTKFDSHCGWPSFDDEIRGAVQKQPDPDNLRTEITCANCGAHLGHMFEGEGLTPKNVRHCVNSVSLQFVPYDFKRGESHSAVLAGGCFWCLEAAYKMLKGVLNVVPGYAGGYKSNPTYEEVLSGSTGHAEAVEIIYDPDVISYRSLLEIFFTLHDPTGVDEQGPDFGQRYRSLILYQTWRQKEESEKMIKELEDARVYENPIVTEVRPLVAFYPAEEEHQDYFTKQPQKPYCRLVIAPKLEKVRTIYRKLLR